jgi:hypothetical protein
MGGIRLEIKAEDEHRANKSDEGGAVYAHTDECSLGEFGGHGGKVELYTHRVAPQRRRSSLKTRTR